MTSPDSNGWLPLHDALHENAPLGTIKLIVRGYLWTLEVADNKGALPLHIACEFSSAGVVEYLLELDDRALNQCDTKNDTALHFACRGGNCSVVTYLLKRNVPAVSERNLDNKLPIELLFEAGEDKIDRDGTEFVETVWLLLLANPMALL